MFSLVSGIYESYWASPQINLLVVGAQGVGKTTLLERIKVTQFNKKPALPSPTTTTTTTSKQHHGTSMDDLLIQAFLTSLSVGTVMVNNDKNDNDDVQSPAVFASKTATKETTHHNKNQHAADTANTKKQRLAWVCPAPKRYANAATEADDDNDDDENDKDEDKNDSAMTKHMVGQEKAERTGSMESIDLSRETIGEGAAAAKVALQRGAYSTSHPSVITTTTTTAPNSSNDNNFQQKEFDVKPGAKMISLHRIRPTIGMNLGKVELCGAKCHFWDLGGRLQDLWERYYLDCDAVVFVWKINSTSSNNNSNNVATDNDDDDDDSDDEIPEITPQLQQGLLEKVRNAIPDDVPFLILGHVFDNNASAASSFQKGSQQQRRQQAQQIVLSSQQNLEMDKLYGTSRLLPHYHNPHQAVCLASAISGQGVRFAMEWLIPLAKRQHRIRDQQQRSLLMMPPPTADSSDYDNHNSAKKL